MNLIFDFYIVSILSREPLWAVFAGTKIIEQGEGPVTDEGYLDLKNWVVIPNMNTLKCTYLAMVSESDFVALYLAALYEEIQGDTDVVVHDGFASYVDPDSGRGDELTCDLRNWMVIPS